MGPLISSFDPNPFRTPFQNSTFLFYKFETRVDVISRKGVSRIFSEGIVEFKLDLSITQSSTLL